KAYVASLMDIGAEEAFSGNEPWFEAAQESLLHVVDYAEGSTLRHEDLSIEEVLQASAHGLAQSLVPAVTKPIKHDIIALADEIEASISARVTTDVHQPASPEGARAEDDNWQEKNSRQAPNAKDPDKDNSRQAPNAKD